MSANLQALREQAKQLLSLLDDPHPSLTTWQTFFHQRTRAIAEYSAYYDVSKVAIALRDAIKDNAAAKRGDDEYGLAIVTAEENLVEVVDWFTSEAVQETSAA